MAHLNLDENSAKYQIRAYQPGTLQINDTILTKSAIVMPDQLIEQWAPQTIEALTTDSLNIIVDLHPDILLLGTGTNLVFISPEIYGELINAGIGVEIMDTSAACRTYNALSAEDRKVAAALIIL